MCHYVAVFHPIHLMIKLVHLETRVGLQLVQSFPQIVCLHLARIKQALLRTTLGSIYGVPDVSEHSLEREFTPWIMDSLTGA
jgi:hypothetical protein